MTKNVETSKLGKLASKTVPVLPVRGVVIYPANNVPLFVGRIKSLRTVEFAMRNDKHLVLAVQKSTQEEDPKKGDIHRVGTLAKIVQVMTLPDGMLKVVVEGKERVRLTNIVDGGKILKSTYTAWPIPALAQDMEEAYFHLLNEEVSRYVQSRKETLSAEQVRPIMEAKDVRSLAFAAAMLFEWSLQDRQKLLEMPGLYEQVEAVLRRLAYEVDVSNLEGRIRARVREQMQKSQREYYLGEQMRAIQQELGQDQGSELGQLEKKIRTASMPKVVKEKALGELKKLKGMPLISAEATVARNYLDWLIETPWEEKKVGEINLKKAQKMLDEDHYGLREVKDRILEYLAVQSRHKRVTGTILLLVGPPGVGKTSLARSIARATNRPYVRMSLGGIRDEAEIRGHRRTYVGASPGRIVQGMRKAGAMNPLFLLDEIDKMGMDWRGDPAAALLEVLDPEQNRNFSDHYLEVEYDLSKVMFLATANSYNVPIPLLDRMEMIPVAGYTEKEKVAIGSRYLWPKQLEAVRLNTDELCLTRPALVEVVRSYTREAGVRELDRALAKITRKFLRRTLEKKLSFPYKLGRPAVKDILGVPKYDGHMAQTKSQVGVTTGLAWTQTGGDVLFIESVLVPGKGKVTKTGQLGDVMKESITAAEYFIKSHLHELGVDPHIFEAHNLHVHVPEGATPKDGPSAGITMVTSMVSALTKIPVLNTVAMTGEVTLTGKVLPIGGLKEKLLAAIRAGIGTVIIPKANEKDLQNIPEEVKNNLHIVPVDNVRDVLARSLMRPVRPLAPVSRRSEVRVNA